MLFGWTEGTAASESVISFGFDSDQYDVNPLPFDNFTKITVVF